MPLRGLPFERFHGAAFTQNRHPITIRLIHWEVLEKIYSLLRHEIIRLNSLQTLFPAIYFSACAIYSLPLSPTEADRE